MGYRLHARKVNHIEYGTGNFSGCECTEVNQMLRKLCGDGLNMNAEEDVLVINRESLSEAIETIKGMTDGEFAHDYPVLDRSTGKSGVVACLETMLREADPEEDTYITADWF